ncbi:serine--tRNA ligase [Ponticaulis sp.]|uniref:serine--tRNA ligase n=1 Tax=Ponticaulis sp. TaxID=2020902 RepID=UPI000C50B999|nr:serine--tRNA ligase [Ponticaulis sp.]MAJ08167.1 serine--tRNA ligase [Ponticaulis sp.]HBJ93060.1 serine--tRNA ligase [Hyphomonadaceae bacterium]|tara:strand:+ start:108772 stop:110091 length:1320 start_codon:yes stop_codon:yes gene_type:complete
MHDIRFIRDNPTAFDDAMARRYFAAPDDASSWSEKILKLDADVRAAVAQKQEAEQIRNQSSKLIGKAKATGDEAEAQRLMAAVADAKATIEKAGAAEEDAQNVRDGILMSLPNLPYEDVPLGEGEEQNEEVRRWGEPTKLSFEPKSHDVVGENLKAGATGAQMDFEAAVAMSGSRFVALKGPMAKLERALAAFMLDLQTETKGYTEVSPPLLVQDRALVGTGQLPKFGEDLFLTTAGHYLIPTAEVSLTNLVRETIMAEDQLPLRMTAHTPCFRSEAGSAGRDTKGMIRLHQFNKVELVSVTMPEDSDAELERMTGCAEAVLQKLELPYRVMKLSTGDMGFGARRTYDLEVWLPSQDTYREISSCSTCGDFQARRMDAKFKRKDAKKPEFVHTLNGSGLAVGRTLVAVIENYQNEDGSITVPEVLRPYLRGLEKIESVS